MVDLSHSLHSRRMCWCSQKADSPHSWRSGSASECIKLLKTQNMIANANTTLEAHGVAGFYHDPHMVAVIDRYPYVGCRRDHVADGNSDGVLDDRDHH